MRGEPAAGAPRAGISSRVASAGRWAFAARIAGQCVWLARTAVLTRIVSPADFGLFGAGSLILTVLDVFTDPGFKAWLVREQGETSGHECAAWSFHVVRGVLLSAAMLALAGPMAGFFGRPAGTPAVRALSVCLLLQGVQSAAFTRARRRLQFKKQFAYEAAGTGADFAVAVGTAAFVAGPWALVLGKIAGTLAQTAVSYAVVPGRMRFVWSRRKLGEMFAYGRWILGKQALTFLFSHGDDVFVGKALGTEGLGFYQMAYRIGYSPATEITFIVSQVMFPAFSILRADADRVRSAWRRTARMTSFLAFPIAAGVILLAPWAVRIVLGERWTGIIPAMRILALWGLLRSLTATQGPLLRAVGRPDLVIRFDAIRFAAMALLIYPLTRAWGLAGTAAAVLCASAVSDIPFLAAGWRWLGWPAGRSAADLLLPLPGAAAASLAWRAVAGSGDSAWRAAAASLCWIPVYAAVSRLVLARAGASPSALLAEYRLFLRPAAGGEEDP